MGPVLVIALHVAPAAGHHAASEFDLDIVLTYEGTIREFVWANPHIRATLETSSDTGSPLVLEIEGNSPSTLRTMGVSRDSLRPNEKVTAVVSPSRRFPDRTAIGMYFVREDGSLVPFNTNTARLSELGARLPGAGTTEGPADTIFGTWVAQGGPGPLGQQSRQWPLTDEGQRRFDAYTPLMSPQAQCIPTSAPWLMAYSAPLLIEQANDRIRLTSDWMQAERTIFMDGREHPPADSQFQQGHSVGRWESDTLVVDTSNFTEIIYSAIANGARKHLIERFALSEDGRQLVYDFVMEDPDYLIGEVSGQIRFEYRPDLTLENLACDSESARRFFSEFQ